MSYGFYKLPHGTSAEKYVEVVAQSRSIVIAVAVTDIFQENGVLGITPNNPGDDQSMPEMSLLSRLELPKVSDTLLSQSKAQGYSGDVCAHCQGSRLRWAGHCQVCEDCGSTTGCS